MSGFETLWDWRRTIADLYGAIRSGGDPRSSHAVWQATRRRLFASHAQSPIEITDRSEFNGPFCYDYDPAFRILVALSPLHEAAMQRLDVGEDGTVNLQPFARTTGLQDLLGNELTLYWIGGYGGGVFLPFADATSGRETYGAGRYLLDTIKGADLGRAADGRAILDFNFAYYPSCAYSDRYVCPLAPVENRLPLPVRAGERQAP